MSVYLPHDVYRKARDHGLPISTLAQQAIESALRRAGTDRWAERVRTRPARVRRSVDTVRLLDEARDEFGA